MPAAHQQRAQVGVAEAEGAVVVAALGDLRRGEVRHGHRDLEHDGPQPDGVAVGVEVERPVGPLERNQVQRGQVARRVVQKDVLTARVCCPDAAAGGGGVPLLDGGVELDPGVGALPGRLGDLTPQVTGPDRLHHPTVGAGGQVPVGVVEHRLDELVGQAHRVVRVLPGHGGVGLAVEVGVVPGGDQRPDLVLLVGLPVDERLDVGVVDVEDDHLGGAPGGASGLDGAGGAVTHLEEAHQPRRLATAG